MDVHLPEFERRWRMAVRLMRALPLLIALVVVVGAGLFTLHVALPGVLLGAALIPPEGPVRPAPRRRERWPKVT